MLPIHGDGIRFMGVAVVMVLIAPLQAQEITPERGLLWRIYKQDFPTSYLFATIHSEDPRVLDLPGYVSQVIKAADTVVLEASVDDQAGNASLQHMLFTDDRRLSTVLSANLFEDTLRAMEDRGFSKEATERLKPWAVSIILSVPRPKTGLFLDLYLANYARRNNIPVKALEAVVEQHAILDGFELNEQVIMLQDTLAELEQIPRLHEQLVEAYLEGDLSRLAAISEQSMGTGSARLASKLKHRLILERNYRMIQRLEPLLRERRLFIAVGALHLLGTQGLLALLQAKGYRLTAVY
jgi:uncharacterized protein YbaP (TraB family)